MGGTCESALAVLCLFLICVRCLCGGLLEVKNTTFIYSDFRYTTKLSLQQSSTQSDGRLQLTPIPTSTSTSGRQNVQGRVVYEDAIELVSADGRPVSFSTEFSFQIVSPSSDFGGDGLAFFMAPTLPVPIASGGMNLGVANGTTSQVDESRHLVAVEFDTYQNVQLQDISSSHIGINVNSMVSLPAPINTSSFDDPLNLHLNYTFRARIDYFAPNFSLEVRLANLNLSHQLPPTPSLQAYLDLSTVLLPAGVYIGLSASSGDSTEGAVLYTWSFNSSEYPASPTPSPAPARAASTFQQPAVSTATLSTSLKIIIGITSVVLVIFLLICICMSCMSRKKLRPHTSGGSTVPPMEGVALGPFSAGRLSADDIVQPELGQLGQLDRSKLSEAVCLLELPYDALANSVQNFSENPNALRLGKGSYGIVFRGTLEGQESEVAVKKLLSSIDGRDQQEMFIKELNVICNIPPHANLLNILGWCFASADKAYLVYEYLPKGDLSKYVYGERQHEIADSKVRMHILLGVAEGLLHLHNQKVLHRDVKASNVLLTNNMEAVLCDFGLMRFLRDENDLTLSTQPAGSRGYWAPEIALDHDHKPTEKSDVYSFGVLALMIACGQNVTLEQGHIIDWVKKKEQENDILQALDQLLRVNENSEQQWKCVLTLGLRCTKRHKESRPTMRDVVSELLDEMSCYM